MKKALTPFLITLITITFLLSGCQQESDSSSSSSSTSDQATVDNDKEDNETNNDPAALDEFSFAPVVEKGKTQHIVIKSLGEVNETLFYQIISNDDNVMSPDFKPNSGIIVPKESKGLLDVEYTAPIIAGKNSYTFVLTNSQNESIKKAFSIEVTE